MRLAGGLEGLKQDSVYFATDEGTISECFFVSRIAESDSFRIFTILM